MVKTHTCMSWYAHVIKNIERLLWEWYLTWESILSQCRKTIWGSLHEVFVPSSRSYRNTELCAPQNWFMSGTWKRLGKEESHILFLPLNLRGCFHGLNHLQKYIFLWPPKEDRNNKTRPPRPTVTCGVTWNSGGLPQLENVLPNRWEQSSSPFPGPGSEIYFFGDFYMLRIFSAIYSYRLGLTSPRVHERPKENIAVCQRLMIPVHNFYWSIDAVFAARQDFCYPFQKEGN